MKNIVQLLEDLYAMSPISNAFKKDIIPMMKEKRYKSRPLQYIDKMATKAWQLLEGTLIAMTYNETGKLIVIKIYKQRQIVCDLISFFEGKPTTVHILAIGTVKVLELRKEDFFKLEKYAETSKLAQHIMMQEEQTETRRANMIGLPPEDRVAVFAKNYPINDLPNLYCALFLSLDVEEFTTLKGQLNLENEARHILMSTRNQKKISELALKAKAYIEANFRDPEFGNTETIADQFFVTKKTLNRAFTDAFGTTIHKFAVNAKMEAAKILLTERKNSVGLIALELGYIDIYKFSRAFKTYFQFSPSDFIKSLPKNN